MNALRRLVVRSGARTPLGWLITAIVVLNVAWLVVLGAVGAQFERLAGVPLLDLQNSVLPGEAMTPSRAVAQIASYPPEAISLYWSFFILDNVMPPLVFGAFALLWANLLHGRPGRLGRAVLGTAVVLVPLGVGAFDVIENLAYVTAITGDPATATPALWIGLVAKWVKAAFLQATFLITLVVVVGAALGRRRAARAAATPGAPAGGGAALTRS